MSRSEPEMFTPQQAKHDGLVRHTNWYDMREPKQVEWMNTVVNEALDAGKRAVVVPYRQGSPHLMCVWTSTSKPVGPKQPKFSNGLPFNMKQLNPTGYARQ